MREDSENVFYSKIDKWLILVIVFGLVVAISACIPVILCESFLFSFSVIMYGLILFALIIDSIIRCRYTFKNDYLDIRSGIFVHVKIPYKSIINFHDSHNLLSAPACSIDRIKIVYGNKKFGIQPFTLVSPRDKSRFSETLKLFISR